MHALNELIKPLTALEEDAKRAISNAAAAGRFDDIVDLVEFAKQITEILNRWNSTSEDPNGLTIRRNSSRAETKVESSFGSGDYPKFLREKDDLVKIGWSTKERKPYEHRAPKRVLDELVKALLSKGKDGHRFSMKEVKKSVARTKRSEVVPSYQIYAVMSWLKWSGMLLQHGRQGYTVVRPQTFSQSIETAWRSLPIR